MYVSNVATYDWFVIIVCLGFMSVLCCVVLIRPCWTRGELYQYGFLSQSHNLFLPFIYMQNNHGSTEIPNSIKKIIKGYALDLKKWNFWFIYIYFLTIVYLCILPDSRPTLTWIHLLQGTRHHLIGYVGVESMQDSRSGTIWIIYYPKPPVPRSWSF